jgi:3-deoxy-manno-octulosonate cytidylyltransferase (CMP-KDO synthetase)
MGRIVAVIPARMGSSRFPGKPLAPLLGRPMIEHIFLRAMLCDVLDEVYVATCDEEVRAVVEGFGGTVILTSAAHERASDRVAEAIEIIEADGRGQADIVVMIQGDEPMITPDMIAAAVAPMLSDPTVSCVNMVRRILSRDEFVDPNTIKVVMNSGKEALYFSRTPIPAIDFAHDVSVGTGCAPLFKQVCVIPFRRNFLSEFARQSPTTLERIESIDMLRVIEHGGSVRLVETDVDTHAVDTTEDLALVEALMKHDPLLHRYGERVAPGSRGRL